ncbi:MAG: hypothetical protein EAZ57_11760 [Cytophagales bacterium]|nr:MAG: hypothetical protein EAZ67_12810 [Cytophagales bacterium]TAF59267.1 MAG: hypothetical protein EAZ57_11760 [Cytophagales bacterium]
MLCLLPLQLWAQGDARDLSGTISARYKIGGQSFSYATKKAAKMPNTLNVSIRRPNEAFGKTEIFQTILKYTDIAADGTVTMQMHMAEPDGIMKWKILPDNYLKATFNRGSGTVAYELVGDKILSIDTEGKGNRQDKLDLNNLGYREMYKSVVKQYIRSFKQNLSTNNTDPYTFTESLNEGGLSAILLSQRRLQVNKQCDLVVKFMQGSTQQFEYQTVYEPKVDLAEPHLLKFKIFFSQANGFFWLIDKVEHFEVTFDYLKGKMFSKVLGSNMARMAEPSTAQEMPFDVLKIGYKEASKMAITKYLQVFKKLTNNPAPNTDKLLGEILYKGVDYQYEIVPGLGRPGTYSVTLRSMEFNEDEEYEIKQVFQTNLNLTEDDQKAVIRFNYAESAGYAWKVFASDAFQMTVNKSSRRVEYALSGMKITTKILKLDEEKMRKQLREGDYTTIDWLRLATEQLIVQCQPLFKEAEAE